MARRDKPNYYLDIAEVVAIRSTCLRRTYGVAIVTNDEIIATGYNGAPRGRANCIDLGECVREKMDVPRGERYELCRAVHAEANAIISAGRAKVLGGTIYMVGVDAQTGKYVENANSCSMCKRLIINAGIKKVVVRQDENNYKTYLVQDWIDNDESLDGSQGY